MVTAADNTILSTVARGTPLGAFMRRYWHPIALSSQVQANGNPLRTQLLGESFVVFRDSSGRVGVLDEHCTHRGVSLALGRNEGGGLRCLYHGWKFAVDGTLLETPNHADCALRRQLKAPAYPVRERSGLIWTYIGPAEQQPPIRSFAFDAVPDSQRTVFRANTRTSWLALHEGGLDSSHVVILHSNLMRPGWQDDAVETDNIMALDMAPRLKVADTIFGMRYCALRGPADGPQNARQVPAVLPNIRFIPMQGSMIGAIEVPMSDCETATYVILYSHDRSIDRDQERRWHGFDSPFYDEKSCNVTLDWSAGLGQDRSIMTSNWSGYVGVEMEDFAIATSIGSDWDRTKEHLIRADIAVARWRRRLLAAVREVEAGAPPPGLDLADMTGVEGYDRTLASGESWLDHTHPVGPEPQAARAGALEEGPSRSLG